MNSKVIDWLVSEDARKLRIVPFFPQIMWTLWVSFMISTFFLMSNSFVLFLYGLSEIPSGSNFAIVNTFVEFVKLLISGWVFFTVFFKPKTSTLIPGAEIREDLKETFKMFKIVSFALSCRVFLHNTVFLMIGLNLSMPIWKYIVCGGMVLILGIHFLIEYYRYGRLKNRDLTNDLSIAAQLSDLQCKALSKINKKLDESEQREIAQLAYRTEKLDHSTIYSLFKIVWGGAIIALLYEVVEEMLGRL